MRHDPIIDFAPSKPQSVTSKRSDAHNFNLPPHLGLVNAAEAASRDPMAALSKRPITFTTTLAIKIGREGDLI